MDTTHGTRLPKPARLAQMQRHGFLTESEAEAIRHETDPDRLNQLIRTVRVRHAQTRLEPGLAGGTISSQDTEPLLERLKQGEHTRQLRTAVIALAKRHQRPDAPSATSDDDDAP